MSNAAEKNQATSQKSLDQLNNFSVLMAKLFGPENKKFLHVDSMRF
jgi:hypothetical protein